MADLSGFQKPVSGYAELTYAYVVGSGTGTYVEGYRDDWYAIRGANDDTLPSKPLTIAANVLEYFDGDNAAFDANPVWVYIPIWAAGWATFVATVRNKLQVSMRLDVYAVPVMGPVTAVGGPVTNQSIWHTIVAALDVPDSTSVQIGPGGTSLNSVSMWPVGYLVIKMTPASDPSAGNTYWSLGVERGR